MTDTKLPTDTQAILLLCGYFGKKKQRSTKPLALREYNALAAWLRRENLRPADLLHEQGEARLQHFNHDKLTQERLRALLGRGVELGFAVEEWARQGIWIISRGENTYPAKLKERLRAAAPPLLYGVGEQALMDHPALGMVGSRDADDEALALTREVAQRCAEEEIMVVSGGARGVDQVSMFSALEIGGPVLAVLAEGVAKPAVSKKYRAHLAEGRLALVSPYHPHARWTVGNAMGRNKHIYAFSNWTLAVSAGTKGGTWSGATENLKHGWTPMLIRAQDDLPEGNRKLLERGAIPFHPEHQRNTPRLLRYLHEIVRTAPSGDGTPDLFSTVNLPPSQKGQTNTTAHHPGKDSQKSPLQETDEQKKAPSEKPTIAAPDIGDLFPLVWPSLALALDEERTDKEMAELFEPMQVGQMRTWLRKAVGLGLVEKRTRPVRYVLKEQED